MTPVVFCLLLSTQAAAQPPADFHSISAAANAAREAGKVGDAVELYRRALIVDPEWEEGWFYLGTLLFSTDDSKGAVSALASVLKRHPKNGVAWALTGLSQFELKSYDEALRALERARRHGVGGNSDLVAATSYTLAVLLNRSGRFDEARRELELLVQQGLTEPRVAIVFGASALLLPRLPSELNSRQSAAALSVGTAVVTALGGDKANAERQYRYLIARDPEFPNVHYAYGRFLLRDKRPEAIDEFRREIANTPSHVPARLQIAGAYLDFGDPAPGLPFAREAVKLGPEWYLTHQILGRVLLHLENGASEAVKELEKAVELRPDDAQSYFQLGRAYALAGRPEDAARAGAKSRELESSIRNEPDLPDRSAN